MLTNSTAKYGLVSVLLHWSMAVAFIAMYALGLWMVDLNYYHSWYHRAPELHKSIGIILVGLMLLRLLWNRAQPRPADLSDSILLRRIARGLHNGFYLLVLLMFISGYLISTAKGKGIDVFELFSIPALLAENEQRGELAGDIHEILGHLFIALALVHAGAALKHHFVERDPTLVRMFGIVKTNQGEKP